MIRRSRLATELEGALVPSAPYSSPTADASIVEISDALRFVESDGVMKVSGQSGDVHEVDDDEVMRMVKDPSLKVRRVHWCPMPFTKGGMRFVHHMWDHTDTTLPLVAKAPSLAVSRSNGAMASFTANRAFLEMHGHAAKLAAAFNRRLAGQPSQEVHFVDAFVYFLLGPDREIKHCFNAEPLLSGEFMKFNDNNGNVLSKELDCSRLAQAFSHFSYEYADQSSIIVDIQGVGLQWTDPQMHSDCGKRYGPGDLGRKGIKRFFKSHRCNEYCKRLDLQHPSPTTAQAASSNAEVAASAMQPSVVMVASTVVVPDDQEMVAAEERSPQRGTSSANRPQEASTRTPHVVALNKRPRGSVGRMLDSVPEVPRFDGT